MDSDIIDCSHAAKHIWMRHGLRVEWVPEACRDADRVILNNGRCHSTAHLVGGHLCMAVESSGPTYLPREAQQ